MPWVSVVLPAPRSPVRTTRSPGRSRRRARGRGRASPPRWAPRRATSSTAVSSRVGRHRPGGRRSLLLPRRRGLPPGDAPSRPARRSARARGRPPASRVTARRTGMTVRRAGVRIAFRRPGVRRSARSTSSARCRLTTSRVLEHSRWPASLTTTCSAPGSGATISSLCDGGVSRSPSPTMTSTSSPSSAASACRLSCVGTSAGTRDDVEPGRGDHVRGEPDERVRSPARRTSSAARARPPGRCRAARPRSTSRGVPGQRLIAPGATPLHEPAEAGQPEVDLGPGRRRWWRPGRRRAPGRANEVAAAARPGDMIVIPPIECPTSTSGPGRRHRRRHGARGRGPSWSIVADAVGAGAGAAVPALVPEDQPVAGRAAPGAGSARSPSTARSRGRGRRSSGAAPRRCRAARRVVGLVDLDVQRGRRRRRGRRGPRGAARRSPRRRRPRRRGSSGRPTATRSAASPSAAPTPAAARPTPSESRPTRAAATLGHQDGAPVAPSPPSRVPTWTPAPAAPIRVTIS